MIPLNKEKRYLLIAGMVLLLVGAVYRFYQDFLDVFTRPDEVTFKENELTRYRKALQEKGLLEAELLSTERELARNEAALLSKGTASLAAVDIQNMVNDLGELKKVDIKSMRVLEPKRLENAGYMTVPLEIAMTGSIRQLKEVLFGIENSQKLLKVSAIRIRIPNMNHPEELHCTVVVEGFMKGE